MVSKMRTAYLKYDSQSEENELTKKVNINPKIGVSTFYCRGLPSQCTACPLSGTVACNPGLGKLNPVS